MINKIAANVLSKKMMINIDGKMMSIRDAKRLQKRLINKAYKNDSQKNADEWFNKNKHLSDKIDIALKDVATDPYKLKNVVAGLGFPLSGSSDGGIESAVQRLALKNPIYSSNRRVEVSDPVRLSRRAHHDAQRGLTLTPMSDEDVKKIGPSAKSTADLRKKDIDTYINTRRLETQNRPISPKTVDERWNDVVKKRENALASQLRNYTRDTKIDPVITIRPYDSPGFSKTIKSGRVLPNAEDRAKINDLEKTIEETREFSKNMIGNPNLHPTSLSGSFDLGKSLNQGRVGIHKAHEQIQTLRDGDIKSLSPDLQNAIAQMRASFVKKSSYMSKVALDISQINKVLDIAKGKNRLVDLRGDKKLTNKKINEVVSKDIESLKKEVSPAFGRKLSKFIKNETYKNYKDDKGAYAHPISVDTALDKLNRNAELQSGALQLKNKKYRKISNTLTKAFLNDELVPSNLRAPGNEKARDLVSGMIGLHELSELKGIKNLIHGKHHAGANYSAQGGKVLSSHVGQQVLEDLRRARTLKGEGALDATKAMEDMRGPEVQHMVRTLGKNMKSRYSYGNSPTEITATPLQKMVSAQQSDKLIGQEATNIARDNMLHNQKILSKVPEHLHNHPMVQSRLKSVSINDAIHELREGKYKINSNMRNFIYKKLDEKTSPGDVNSHRLNMFNPEHADLSLLRASPKYFKGGKGGGSTRMRRK